MFLISNLLKFSIPTAKDIPELKKFLIKEFFTSEPLCKNMIENGGKFSKKMATKTAADFICGKLFWMVMLTVAKSM